MNLHESPGFLVNKLAHSMKLQLEKRLNAYNVTTSQWAILALLWKKEGVAQIELQQALGLDKATVTGLLQRMSASGFIERSPDANDKRIVRVHLTDQGRSLETQIIPHAIEVNRLALEIFTDEEQELFVSMLRRAIRSIDSHS